MTQCPEGTNQFTRRVHRRGWSWEYLLSYLHLYPYRCQIYSHRFKVFKPSKRYAKRPIDRREHLGLGLDIVFNFLNQGSLSSGELVYLQNNPRLRLPLKSKRTIPTLAEKSSKVVNSNEALEGI